MCVDGHGRVLEIFIEDDIGGFASYAGELDEGVSVFGDLAAVFIDENLRRGDHIFGFGVIQTNGFYMVFQAVNAEGEHFLRRVDDFEQGFCGFVDADICGLSGKGDRDEERGGICPFQIAFGLRVYCVEPGEELRNIRFGYSFFVRLGHRGSISVNVLLLREFLLT